MTYYHVRITQKLNGAKDETKLDLTLEELENQIVRPYKHGQTITINGRTILTKTIERIKISNSSAKSDFLQPNIIQNPRAAAFATTGSIRRYTVDSSEDVTDKFITGPPEFGVEASHTVKKQPRPMEDARDIFVVHGRNLKARDALFDFLRAIDLRPLEWSEAVQAMGKASPYIGEILDAAFSRAHAVIVLLTPDDEARLSKHLQAEGDPPHETELTGQARPNVLFEAGMAMAGNQGRTVLVELGRLRPFSDVAGRHAIRLDNSSQRRQELAQRLKLAGCPVNLDGTDWHTAGDFESAIKLLDLEVANPVVNETREEPIDEQSQLSEDAKELLIEARKDRAGIIMVGKMMVGKMIYTNGKRFGEQGNSRSEARWEQAIEDLFEEGLIDDPAGTGSVFKLTHRGFQLVDQLANQG